MDYLEFIIFLYLVRRVFNTIDKSIKRDDNYESAGISFGEFFSYIVNLIPHVELKIQKTPASDTESETEKYTIGFIKHDTNCEMVDVKKEQNDESCYICFSDTTDKVDEMVDVEDKEIDVEQDIADNTDERSELDNIIDDALRIMDKNVNYVI